jgi:hypothetical protein
LCAPSMHLHGQQLWHHGLPAPSSPVLNRASLMGSSDWDGSQESFGDQRSAYGSGVGQHTAPHSPCSPTISWALSHGPEMSPAQRQLRNDAQAQSSCSTPDSSSCQKPAACRCLCAALLVHSSSPAAAAAQESDEEEECSTPRKNMIPSVLPPPGAPRAPRPTARALLPARPFAGSCAHFSTEGRGRLQQWLDHMELKLAVPQSPAGPSVEACMAPKVASAHTSYRPVLDISAGSTGAGRLSRAGGPDMGRTAPAQPRARSFAGQLSSSSGSSSSSYSKKRALPALDTLSLSASGVLRMGAAASSSASDGAASDDSGLASVHNSKRRSHNGASGSGTVAAAGPASAVVTSPGAGSSTCGCHLPAPAFDILGLISGTEQQR